MGGKARGEWEKTEKIGGGGWSSMNNLGGGDRYVGEKKNQKNRNRCTRGSKNQNLLRKKSERCVFRFIEPLTNAGLASFAKQRKELKKEVPACRRRRRRV